MSSCSTASPKPTPIRWGPLTPSRVPRARRTMTHQANVNEPRDETTPTWVLTGDEPNGTDVVAKTWTGAAARTIDCLPATGDGDVGEGDFATPAEVDECDRA